MNRLPLMERKETILREDFTAAPCLVAGYESFMEGLLDIVRSGKIDEVMGEQVKAYVLDYVRKNPLVQFARFSGDTYVRNYIGRDVSGWEAIVMSWKKAIGLPFTRTRNLPGTLLPTGNFLSRYSNLAKEEFAWSMSW